MTNTRTASQPGWFIPALLKSMDITGARWSTNGAETVLKLRAIRANNDFEAYWRYHLDRERQRVHETRYDNGVIPIAA